MRWERLSLMYFHVVRACAGEASEASRSGSESHERGAIRVQVRSFRSLPGR